jgi:CheY-like chemotaxis protein
MHTILVAEDHEETRELFREVLNLEAEWNVAAMPSGTALLKTAWSLLPDLVILDVSMPGLDGLATHELLRQRPATRDVPILFVTANPARLCGVPLRGRCDTLVKPFGMDEFVAHVSVLLGCSLPTLHARA